MTICIICNEVYIQQTACKKETWMTEGITFHLKHTDPLDLKTWSDPNYFFFNRKLFRCELFTKIILGYVTQTRLSFSKETTVTRSFLTSFQFLIK